jgi:hypothetical protein
VMRVSIHGSGNFPSPSSRIGTFQHEAWLYGTFTPKLKDRSNVICLLGRIEHVRVLGASREIRLAV